MPAVLLALATTCATGIAFAQTTYVSDPLSSPPSGGAAPGVTAGTRGGSFGAGGWTTTGATDTVWWVIPATIPRGRFEVTATGLSTATSLVGQEHDLVAIYGPTDRAEPISYIPWYRNNEFKVFVRVFGALNTCAGCQAVGSSKLELALCPALSPLGYVETMCPAACVAAGFSFWQAYLGPRGRGEPLPWDAATPYRFVITWEPGRMTYTRGGPEGASSLTFPGTYAPRELHVRIGPPSSERGPDTAMPRGVTFSNVLVQGDPGAGTPSCSGTTPPPDASAPADATPADTGSATSVIESPVIEDVTVTMLAPTTVYPDVRDLAVEVESEVYLKFRVDSVPGRVVRAEILLRSAASPSAEGSGASAFRAAGTGWSETTLTWSARPGRTGERLARVTGVQSDMDYVLDVTPAITGAGTYAFALVTEPGDTNGVHFDSKEVTPARGPRLRLTVDTTPPPVDAGTADAAADAGMDVTMPPRDGSVDGGRADSGRGSPVEGGCSCRSAGPARGSSAIVMLAIAGSIAARRRRATEQRVTRGDLLRTRSPRRRS